METERRVEIGSVSFLRDGSFDNETYVTGHSDLYFSAVIPESSPKRNSHRLLINGAAALRVRFPNSYRPDCGAPSD